MTSTPAKRLPLSVSLIASNEAANLPRCLASVQEWCAEIVVVTNDCRDDTEEIARRHGARVVPNAWKDFQDQKNVSLDACTQPWVLCLDADEEVSLPLRAEIEDFFRTGQHERFAAADLPRKSLFLGRWLKHGDAYPDRCLRLLRRGASRWGGDRSHTFISATGPMRKLKADLLHYSYPSLAIQFYKLGRQADDFARNAAATQRRFSMLDALFRPGWRFFRAYVLRLGFLDGYPGFYLAAATSFSALLRYSRLYEAEHSKTTPPKS